MFQILYGSTAAGLYDQAAKLNAQARTLYLQSSDTYYKANDGASVDRAEPNRTFCFACMMRRAGGGLCIRRLHARLQRYARAADSALPSPAVPPSPCVTCGVGPFPRAGFLSKSRGVCARLGSIVCLPQPPRTTTGSAPAPTGITSTTARRRCLYISSSASAGKRRG